MSTDIILAPITLPDTVDGVIEAVKMIDISIEQYNVIAWWKIGELIRHLGESNDEPVSILTARTEYSDRALRYATAVRQVFADPVELARLASLGLRWSSVRELAGDALEPHRAHLLKLFESGRLTNTEVYDQAIALRSASTAAGKATAAAALAGEDGAQGEDPENDGAKDEALLCRTAAKITTQATKLQKDVVETTRGFRDKLADALLADDGSLRSKAEAQVVLMNSTLQKLITEATELLYRASILIIVDDYPFQELEDRLKVIREDFRKLAEDPIDDSDDPQTASSAKK